jgi:hypothetical protein
MALHCLGAFDALRSLIVYTDLPLRAGTSLTVDQLMGMGAGHHPSYAAAMSSVGKLNGLTGRF